MNDKNAIIIGGTGFLGVTLVNRLIDDGYHLTVVGRRSNPFIGEKNITYCQADITERVEVDRISDSLNNAERAVFLPTAMPYATEIRDDWSSAVKINIIGAFNILETINCECNHIEKICYVSTIDIYGKPEPLPADESSSLKPLSNYAKTKLVGETLFSDYCLANKIDLTILRFTQLYGPNDNSPKIVTSVIKKMLKGQKPEIYGDGSDMRDMLFIDDAARAICHWFKGGKSGTYNVATGQSNSIKEIVCEVLNQSNSDVEPEFFPRKKERIDYVFNVEKMVNEFGFSPKVNLKDGLKATIEWLRQSAVECKT